MTGPEHYAAGDELVEESKSYAPDEDMYLGLMAGAQAHYTAAAAAAAALNGSPNLPPTERREWLQVAATKQEPVTPRQHSARAAT